MESIKESNFKEWNVLEKIIFLYYGFAFFADLEIDESEEEAIVELVLNFSEISDEEFIEVREKCLAKIVELGSQPMFTSNDGNSIYLECAQELVDDGLSDEHFEVIIHQLIRIGLADRVLLDKEVEMIKSAGKLFGYDVDFDKSDNNLKIDLTKIGN